MTLPAAFVAAGGDCPVRRSRRLAARSTVLRFLSRSASKPGGRPPRKPLRRRAARLLVCSGMVCRLPRLRRYRRQGPLPCCDGQGQRAAAAIGAQAELGGEPAAGTAQVLTSRTTSTRRACRPCRPVPPRCSARSATFEAGAGGGPDLPEQPLSRVPSPARRLPCRPAGTATAVPTRHHSHHPA